MASLNEIDLAGCLESKMESFAKRIAPGYEGAPEYFSVNICAIDSAILDFRMSIAFLTAIPFKSVPADAAVAEVLGRLHELFINRLQPVMLDGLAVVRDIVSA